MPAPKSNTNMAATRRRKLIGHRRRVDDEGEDEGGLDQLDLEDDSMSEGSFASDDIDNEHDADSDTSNIDETSPVAPNVKKSKAARNGVAKAPTAKDPVPQAQPDGKPASDTHLMMHGLSLEGKHTAGEGEHFDDAIDVLPKPTSNGPLVVTSDSAAKQPAEPVGDRRRREHEEYKRRRDEDPAFVPNRGAFFMHDHRHAGPAANGFRPFGRGRGRGRGGFGGPFAPVHQLQPPSDPLTSGQWAHDMHEDVVNPQPSRPVRHAPPDEEGPPNGNGIIPTCSPNPTPINRTMSTEKHVGNVQVRVSITPGKPPSAFAMPVRQYTKLPDHRPPLRRDKPVRISLPDNAPKYIFPAVDRSFIFIPRAMRPNQQRTRGKPRSGLGSMGGFSRRTSVFGGSFYGSAYSPSIALSRRSSLAPDGRDYMFSPTGSVVSRPPMPLDNPRPVVRLPPAVQQPQISVDGMVPIDHFVGVQDASLNGMPQPHTHPLPQKPIFQENRQQSIPMHQPRPQKTVSVAGIESPTLDQQPFHQAFHQQVPPQVSNGLGPDGHSRQPSYPSHLSTGTPLSHIPERAIHAAPFQPTHYGQQNYYGHQQSYGMMPQQPGYYQPPAYNGGVMPSPASAVPFIPASQQAQSQNYPQQSQYEQHGPGGNPGMVAQEVNGMVYYYDASQMPPSNNYQGYQGPPVYGSGVPGMAGMVTPSPDGFFYPQQAPGMVYYPQ
ncbi:CASC3/Barentsz eIF4AIII binding-domain-containing protein [Verticillium dahliae]|nr:CASC3/Barentsz eIF4AIII binding-domain-containing protein [Verticillium dahliae]